MLQYGISAYIENTLTYDRMDWLCEACRKVLSRLPDDYCSYQVAVHASTIGHNLKIKVNSEVGRNDADRDDPHVETHFMPGDAKGSERI